MNITKRFRPEFTFYAPVRVFFKRGAVQELAQKIQARHCQKIMIVTDENVAALCGKKVIQALANDKFHLTVWDGVKCEPTIESVIPGVETALHTCPDLIVGLGGGSAMDSAKLIAVAAWEKSLDVKQFLKPSTKQIQGNIPLVTIPTTAGTGAEITRGIVMIDSADGIKKGFSKGGCYADFTIMDPDLLDSLPFDIVASSGIDAFCHALEAYLSPTPFPISDALVLYALDLIKTHFQTSLKHPTPVSREAMLIASHMACLAFSTGAGLTISHLFSDIVGARYPILHGYASALLMPGIITIMEKRAGQGRHPRSIRILTDLLSDHPDDNLLDCFLRIAGFARVPHISDWFTKSKAQYLMDQTFKLNFRSHLFDQTDAFHALDYAFAQAVL